MLNTYKPAQMRVLPLLLASLFCASAQAQQTENQLKDVRVEAGIIPDSLELVPGSTSVIRSDEIEQRIPFSIQDAMRSVTGINVVGESAFDVAPNIGVRGLNPRRSARTLLLEDGMPIFLAPYGDPSAHYSTPFERLDRIEVLKGSGQILYGPQSVGGMINFVTKPVPRNGFAGNASASVGTNNFYGLTANVGTGGEWGGVMLDLIKKEGDGIRDNHDFDVTETMFKGEFVLSSRQTLTTKVGYYTERSQTSETGLGSVEFEENPRQAPTGNNDFFQHDRTTVQLIHKLDLSDTATLTTQAYYTDSFRSSLRQINSSGGNAGRSQLERCPAGVDVNNLSNANLCGGRTRPREYEFFGVEPKLDFTHKVFGLDNIATIGLRYHKEDIRRRAFRANTLGELVQETPNINREDIQADITATSVYAQNTFVAGDWSFTPGVRYEEIDQTTNIVRAEGADVGQVNNVEKSEILPGFGVTWTGLEKTTLFAGIHKGFAPPRPDRDLAVMVVGGVPTTTFSSPDPEESTNTEFGVRSTYIDGVNFEATVFNIDFDNLVIEDNGRFLNAGKSVHRGLEVGAAFDLDGFMGTRRGYFAQLGWTHLDTARFDEDRINPGSNIIGNRLPYAPKDIVNLSVGFDKGGPWSAQIGVSYISEQFVDEDNTRDESLNGEEGTVPSYTLWNASVNYKPAGSNLSYFLAAENLFDEEYLASRVDGKQLGRGQQIVVGVRANF
jgi:Fe(3+) dicitrate transport protein